MGRACLSISPFTCFTSEQFNEFRLNLLLGVNLNLLRSYQLLLLLYGESQVNSFQTSPNRPILQKFVHNINIIFFEDQQLFLETFFNMVNIYKIQEKIVFSMECNSRIEFSKIDCVCNK